MINLSLSLHAYLILNVAILIAYVISRIGLHIPYVSVALSQLQQLKYARYCLMVTMIVFIVMPIFLRFLPYEYHSHFQMTPILKSVSSELLSYQTVVAEPIKINSYLYHFSIYDFLIVSLLFGMGLSFIKYIKDIFVLNNYKKEAFCQHKINNIHILFSSKCDVPFCWGFFNKCFIFLPNLMAARNKDIKLTIRHELQHIRQGDAYWLHGMAMIKIICFWNPFAWLWANLLEELQELSCDESIILKNKSMPAAAYAQCLVNAANDYLNHVPSSVLGVHTLSKSFLYRRVDMLFGYKFNKTKKVRIVFAYFILLLSSISAAFALNGAAATAPLSSKQISMMIQEKHIDPNFLTSVKPEVVNEINEIRSSKQARSFMKESLQRMKKYQFVIQEILKKESLPNDLLVVPLVESGYQALPQNKNPVLAAGIWQMIPETAKQFGLVVNERRDDRLDIQLSTAAAISYLKSNYAQFQDWKLAVVAYEIGEKNTNRLIKETGSRDAWILANAASAPKELKKFLSMLDASIIIMHQSSLIN